MQVPAPRLVQDYQQGMGGAGVHDQLCLQRYSVQRVMKLREYYRTIFLGLVDLVLVNGYILHKTVFAKRNPGKATSTHAQFMTAMHSALLGVSDVDFVGDISIEAMFESPLPGTNRIQLRLPSKHTILEVESSRTVNAHGKPVNKRRQYDCKVCSMLRNGPALETNFWCKECTEAERKENKKSDGVIYRCQKVQQRDPNALRTRPHATKSGMICGRMEPLFHSGTS